jgi:hypothetical protein
VFGAQRDDVLALARVEVAAPLMARLFDSVAPDVQTISLGSALTSFATCSRASSTAASVSQPYAWLREAGLPKCSVR